MYFKVTSGHLRIVGGSQFLGFFGATDGQCLHVVPCSSYGESVFLAAQTGAIMVLAVGFSRGRGQALLAGGLFAGGGQGWQRLF
jgi:hypothetical protein